MHLDRLYQLTMSNSYKHTFLIVYPSGGYGTFLDWCINWFSGAINEEMLPFTNNGSAHSWLGHGADDVIPSSVSIDDFLKSQLEPLSYRTHFCYVGQDNKDTPEDLIQLHRSNFRKIILINNNTDCHLLLLHNMLTKARGMSYTDLENTIMLRYKDQFAAHDPIPRWQLREMISFWHEDWDCFLKDMYQPGNVNAVNLEIRSLLDNFEDCLSNLFDQLELPLLRKNRLSEIRDLWLPLQKFTSLDKDCNNIISAVVTDSELDFGNCLGNLFDEAFIQWKLRSDHNLDLLCFDLNNFPSTTGDLRKLLVPLIK